MKKWLVILPLFIFFIVLISLVSAQVDLERGSQQLVDWFIDLFRPIFQALFGGEWSYEFLFEKMLFFLIIMSVAYVALSRIPVFEDNLAIIWIVTVSVALLSTRFLTEVTFVKTILLSYTVLGVALTAAIPFFIYAFFVEQLESGAMRKIFWIFFVVVFFGLWWARYEEVGNLSWIYLITGILALIFLLADGTIRRFIINSQMKELGFQRRQRFESDIRRQIRDVEKDLTDQLITPRQHRYSIRRLRKQLKALRKN